MPVFRYLFDSNTVSNAMITHISRFRSYPSIRLSSQSNLDSSNSPSSEESRQNTDKLERATVLRQSKLVTESSSSPLLQLPEATQRPRTSTRPPWEILKSQTSS